MSTIHLPILLGQALGSSATTQLLFFGALFAIMYFVMIRPQQKQMKEQQAMMAALKKGDDVVTSGGLLGKVFAVSDKELVLEVASGVRVRVLKSSVQSKVTAQDAAPKADETAKKEEK